MVADTLAPSMALAGLTAIDATKHNTIEQQVIAKADVIMGASRKRARSVETRMALSFAPMAL